LHGTGKGNDAVTSGIEGPWTSNPIKWDNEYFKNLINYEWEKYKGPGGAWQWRVKGGNGPKAPMAHGSGMQDVMMLTTDVALSVDPEYRKYVVEFANDEKAFADAFAKVWYKLVNRDMGPVSRLVGPDVAPPQPWQYPLPPPPAKLADMAAVEKALVALMEKNPKDTVEYVRLAENSATTFRHTDYLGGPNGARVRFVMDWPLFQSSKSILASLEPIKKEFGDGLTWADLIVLAGTVAVKRLGAPADLPFSPGRSDAEDGAAWESLKWWSSEKPKSVQNMADRNALVGLSDREFVSLAFPYCNSVAALKGLKDSEFKESMDMWTQTLKYHPVFQRWVEHYIDAGDDVYATDFAKTWTKLMNVDRFDGPVHNAVLQ
jgi:catalase-peroxidase